MYEVAQQSPLQAQHIPAQDLVAAAHGSEALAMLDAIPSGHNGTWLHWDGTLTWDGGGDNIIVQSFKKTKKLY